MKAEKEAADKAAKAKADAEEEKKFPCKTCEKLNKLKEAASKPLPVNATHTIVPVTEVEEKEVIVKNEATGKEEKTKVKIPVVKNKLVPKVAPVAQNATHEIIPVEEEEEKDEEVPDMASGPGAAKTEIIKKKVKVIKNKVVKKPDGEVPLAPAVAPAPVAPAAVLPAAPAAAPVAQNTTHEVVPVTEIEEKVEEKRDELTGEIKKEIVKKPVIKNKVIPKAIAPPVAANSTHEVIPVIEEE